jgi:hypothetical protein
VARVRACNLVLGGEIAELVKQPPAVRLDTGLAGLHRPEPKLGSIGETLISDDFFDRRSRTQAAGDAITRAHILMTVSGEEP